MALLPVGGEAAEATADIFVVCLLRRFEDRPDEARAFIREYERTVREKNGKVQMRSDEPKRWVIMDGKDNLKAPNHLSPACFDFDAIIISAFHSSEDLQTWWSSDEVFSLMKRRDPMEKVGIYAIDGLQQAYDVNDRYQIAFGEKFVLLELMQNQAFKPVQHYVDCYKRYSERAVQEIGIESNLLFAEGVSWTLMSEFPLEAMCCSAWRMRADAHYWYDADLYQKQLLPLRSEYSTSLVFVAPIFEERLGSGVVKRAPGEPRNVLAPLTPRNK